MFAMITAITAMVDLTQAFVLPPVWVIPVSMVIPLIVAAVNHPDAPRAYHQLTAIAGAIAVALLEQVISPDFTVNGLLVAASIAFLTQLSVYLGTEQIVDLNSAVRPNSGMGA